MPGVVGGRFKINNDGNVTCKGNVNCNRIHSTELSIPGGKVGVNNSNPRGRLHLGNVDVANSAESAPLIVFGKSNGSSGFRNA